MCSGAQSFLDPVDTIAETNSFVGELNKTPLALAEAGLRGPAFLDGATSTEVPDHLQLGNQRRENDARRKEQIDDNAKQRRCYAQHSVRTAVPESALE